VKQQWSTREVQVLLLWAFCHMYSTTASPVASSAQLYMFASPYFTTISHLPSVNEAVVKYKWNYCEVLWSNCEVHGNCLWSLVKLHWSICEKHVMLLWVKVLWSWVKQTLVASQVHVCLMFLLTVCPCKHIYNVICRV